MDPLLIQVIVNVFLYAILWSLAVEVLSDIGSDDDDDLG